MTRRLLTPKETAARFTVSRSQLGRMKKAGIGPAPIAVGPRRDAYLESEVEAYIADLAAHRSVAS